VNADPLDSFAAWAMDTVNSQPIPATWVPTPTHRWAASPLGGPMRCQDCGVRIDMLGDDVGCGESVVLPAFTHESWCNIHEGRGCDCVVTPVARWRP
jgi:hypothetical protein